MRRALATLALLSLCRAAGGSAEAPGAAASSPTLLPATWGSWWGQVGRSPQQQQQQQQQREEGSSLLWEEVQMLRTEPAAFAQKHKHAVLDAGWLGLVVIFCVYLVSTVLMLPLWGFHVVVGFVYGPVPSIFFISTTQAVCASAAFLVARRVVRGWVRRVMGRRYKRYYAALQQVARTDGLRIVALLRLSPIIPFGSVNYLCGCTDMPLRHFAVGTWLGLLPGNTVYCTAASAAGKLTEEGSVAGMAQKAMLIVGVAAGVLVVRLVSNAAAAALNDAGIRDDIGSPAAAPAPAAVRAPSLRNGRRWHKPSPP